MNSQYDREEDAIAERYARGEITLAEYNKEMRELQRDHQADAQEAAERAYREELSHW